MRFSCSKYDMRSNQMVFNVPLKWPRRARARFEMIECNDDDGTATGRTAGPLVPGRSDSDGRNGRAALYDR